MAELSRYNVGDGVEGVVLKNKLGITDPKTIGDMETILLADTYEHFFEELRNGKLIFDANLLLKIHKYFLGPLYSWAGKFRTVEMSKGDVLFCASSHIKENFQEFGEILNGNLSKEIETKEDLCKKLAVIHCEFNAIHPFREGNGRTIRLFIDLVVVNYGFSLPDYGKSSKASYIQSCIAGMNKNYTKMEKLLKKVIRK